MFAKNFTPIDTFKYGYENAPSKKDVIKDYAIASAMWMFGSILVEFNLAALEPFIAPIFYLSIWRPLIDRPKNHKDIISRFIELFTPSEEQSNIDSGFLLRDDFHLWGNYATRSHAFCGGILPIAVAISSLGIYVGETEPHLESAEDLQLIASIIMASFCPPVTIIPYILSRAVVAPTSYCLSALSCEFGKISGALIKDKTPMKKVMEDIFSGHATTADMKKNNSDRNLRL